MRASGIFGVGLAALLALPTALAQQSPSLLPPAATREQPVAAPAIPTVPRTPASPQLTPADVEAWLDGYMPYAIKTGDIAGAVVVIVKDGQVLTQRGYGYADVARRTPVDPQRTLFRPGSVSKLVTWTAVMQLVEQGKLDLDADVNAYLDFKIPPRDGKPVTLRNIMTHTAGFEEAVKNIMFYDPAKLAPLGDYLKAWIPARIFPPGTTPAYSNYATALAGYVVERVSGQSFDDYVDRNIFAPLGMDHSTFRQPLPKRLAPTMSKGYTLGSGDASKYEIVGPAPAGSMASTGADMARFMIAHLEQGELDGRRILRPDTIRAMHDSPLTLLPPLNRMQLGFFETNINGRKVIAHLGDTQDFHTSLHLFLAERTGLYVSFNSNGKEGASGSLRTALFEDFADRYFPGKAPTGRVPAEQAAEHARMLSGAWSSTRRSDTTFFNLFELLGQLKVEVDDKGELSIGSWTGLNGKPVKWVETSPFVWNEVDGHQRIAAKVVDGEVVRFSFDMLAPFIVFERPAWYKNSAWLSPLLYGGLLAMLLTVLLWPVAAIVRRRFGAPLRLERNELRAYRLVRVAALLTLLTAAGWAGFVAALETNLDNVTSATDPFIWLLQIASLVVFVGGFAIALWHAWIVWRGNRRWPARLWSIVLVVAALAVLWVGIAFNLISFGVNY